MRKFPDDPDGHVLNLMRENNADFSRAHHVDFFLYFPDRKTAGIAAEQIKQLGFDVEVSRAADYSDWLCIALIQMIPGYYALNRIRKKFEKICENLGGTYDGWGTLLEKEP